MTDHSLDHLRQTGVRIAGIAVFASTLLTIGATWFISPGELGLVALIAAVTGAVPIFSALTGRADAVARTSFGIAVPIYPALMLFVMRGHAWQMDMHMLFFAGVAALMVLCDWRPIVAATLVTAVHHLALSVLVPHFVFDSNGSFARVILHAAILLVESGVLIALAARLVAMITTIAEQNEQVAAADRARREAEREQAAQQQAVFAAQERVTNELQQGLSAIARGDLNHRLSALPSEFRQIESDFNASIGSLSRMIGLVASTSRDVESETGVIAEASSELATQSEMQASAIDETTRAVERMASEIGTIASHARVTAERMDSMEQEIGRAHV
jgi:methyl-accepting chemotaxis protein